MNHEQYERWKDFSRRMVKVVLGPQRKSPSRTELLYNIDFFFECRMDPDNEWERVRDWDHTAPSADQKSRWPYSAMCVSSHLSDLAEGFIPNYWSIVDDDKRYKRAEERFCDPVHICVRAGLDVAVSPSAGVSGYSAGDIRRMYPDGVPDWVKEFFQPGDTIAFYPANIEGIYVPEVAGYDSRTFDELPDAAGVWL